MNACRRSYKKSRYLYGFVSIRQRNYRVDKGGGLAYRRTAAQAVGVSPASL